jgi:hypothetical protein
MDAALAAEPQLSSLNSQIYFLATASMSREISQLNACDGVFKEN